MLDTTVRGQNRPDGRPVQRRGARRRWSGLVTTAVVALSATVPVLATSEPAGAVPVPVPFVACVRNLGNNVEAAFFGYSNPGLQVFVADGPDNLVTPGDPFMGQPETFNTGTYARVFDAEWDSSLVSSVTWIINGESATATADSPPCINGVTAPASALTTSSATLNGAVDPGGEATTWHFDYGTTAPAYGQSTPDQTTSGAQLQLVQTSLANLAPSTTYHFRLVGNNGTTDTDGADQTFTTPAATSGTGSVPALSLAPSTIPTFTG